MKSINLLSLVQAHRTLQAPNYSAFIKHYGIDISINEIADLAKLTDNLYTIFPLINIYHSFYVGYKIQHISKEFDLLRFGSNYIINIELKSNSTAQKIQQQLIRNRYYLSHINKVIHNLCYVSNTNVLYKLDSYGNLAIVGFDYLAQLIASQNLLDIKNPDDLFNPSDYLVSPFNSTVKFIHNQYFLTGQQESIKNSILNEINRATKSIISITGSAGTGKTLLTYDIVKSIKGAKRTLIVHCGKLNSGHMQLLSYRWNIIPIKVLATYELSKIDVLVVDEAQRIFKHQLDKLISDANTHNIHCVFSYDINQTLHHSERRMNIATEISAIPTALSFNLSDKIRTNKEIANFIKLLFNKNRNDVIFNSKGNVDFDYFNDASDVKNFIRLISSDGWEVLRWTASRFNTEHHETYADTSSQNSHTVIGQEFDNVAIVIDQYFYYDSSGD